MNYWVWGASFRTDHHLGWVTQVKSLGAELIEFGIQDGTQVDTKALRRVLENEDLGCTIVAVFGPDSDLSHEDAAVRRRGADLIDRCIEVGAGVGASVCTGAMAGVSGKEVFTSDARRARVDRFVEELGVLGTHAAQGGMLLGIEVLNRYEANLLNTAQHVREVVDLVDHPAVGIMLDTFHMSIEETDVREAVRIAGDKLIHLQAADSHRGTPGDGLFPWQELAGGLKDIDYQADVTIECFNWQSDMAALSHSWRPFAESPEILARDGLAFLKAVLRG